MEAVLPNVKHPNPPNFVPCSHYKSRYRDPKFEEKGLFVCNCLAPELENEIYRFHDNEWCFQKSEKMGHQNFNMDGFFKTHKPVWKNECYNDFDAVTREKIEKLCAMLNLKCTCTCDYTCKICNYITSNKERSKPKLYVNRNQHLDLETLLYVFSYLKC